MRSTSFEINRDFWEYRMSGRRSPRYRVVVHVCKSCQVHVRPVVDGILRLLHSNIISGHDTKSRHMLLRRNPWCVYRCGDTYSCIISCCAIEYNLFLVCSTMNLDVK